ncbi:MAG: SRPBCC family protein [Actinomycetes bacterium]
MLALQHSVDAVVGGTPEQVWAVVSDPTRHPALAGSGEVLALRVVTDGPVRVGTEFEADEDIKFGPSRQKFTARSKVVEFDAPRVMSWTSTPPGKPTPRRIQWWFRLTPDAAGTRVVHRIEVDMGPVGNVLLTPIYRVMRARTIRDGMRGTLENLDKAVREGPGAA